MRKLLTGGGGGALLGYLPGIKMVMRHSLSGWGKIPKESLIEKETKFAGKGEKFSKQMGYVWSTS